MRRRSVVALVIVAAMAVAFMAAVLPPPALRLPPLQTDERELSGSLHVHTRRSDGAGTVDEVAAAAARAGLGFVIFTDHGDGTRAPDPPRYRSGVLCLDGVEISTAGGHYIALGLDRQAPYRLAGEPRDVVEDVARLGGFGIAAHPESAKPELSWRDWSAPIDGVEWLNADSEWRDEPPAAIGKAVAAYLLRSPESIASLFGRPAVLARWDAMTQRRKVVAVAGHDAHARIGLRGNWEPAEEDRSLALPSYEAAFRTFTVRVRLEERPTGDAATDAKRLLDAIRAGRVHTVIDALAAPARLVFRARPAGGSPAAEGDDLMTAGPVSIEAQVPAIDGVSLVLFRNGRVAATSHGSTLTFEHAGAGAGPAVYRVEARLDAVHAAWRVPWIVSNPIRIFATAPPAAPRLEPPRAAAVGPVPANASVTPWLLERDAGTQAALTPAGERGIRLVYRLADGEPRGQYAAAVLTFQPGDFERWDRVRFVARASREMRLSVQVREPRQGRRRVRSVVALPEARSIVVRFDDMRPPEPVLQARLGRAELASLLFVVDTTHTVPGTEGTIVVERVQFERE